TFVTALSGMIPPRGHFIVYTDDYSSTDVEGLMIPGDVNGLQVTTMLGDLGDTTSRSIALFDGSGTKIDGFSIAGGASTPLDYNDGTPFAGATTSHSTQVYARKRPGG